MRAPAIALWSTLLGMSGIAHGQIIVDPDNGAAGNHVPVVSVVYEIGGVQFTQTAENVAPTDASNNADATFNTTCNAGNVFLSQINVTDGTTIAVADRIGGTIDVAENYNGTTGVAVVENATQTFDGDAGFVDAMRRVFSNSDVCDYVRDDAGGVVGVDYVTTLEQPVFPDEFMIVQERNGNSTFDLTPVDENGNVIAGADTVELRGTYDWNTGYRPNTATPNNNQPQFFTVFRVSLFFTTNPGAAAPIFGFQVVNDGQADVKFFAATDGKDYGDIAGYVDARHSISPDLFIGTVGPPDRDPSDQQNAAATADDADSRPGDFNDDDGISSFPSQSTDDGQYTVTVSVTNNTGSTARLCGFIDFDDGGAFESDEEACADVTVSNGASSLDLTFTVPVEDRDNSGAFYARFRLASIASEAETPTGTAADGEVEDYQINISQLPITLASLHARQTPSGLQVEWTTATETRNAGFHIYGRRSGEGKWVPLTDVIMPSKVIDSLEPQRYTIQLEGVHLDELIVEDWSTSGRTRRHGPFSINRQYGFDAVTHAKSIDWGAIHARNAKTRATRDAERRAKGFAKDGVANALLWVETDGIHRVSFDSLETAGADFVGVPIDVLALVENGNRHPRHVIDGNGNGVFDSGDSVEFLGEASESLYSRRNAYRLTEDLSGALVREARNKSLGSNRAQVAPFVDTASVEHNNAYSFASPIDDPWYDAWIFARGGPTTLTREFSLPGYAGGSVELTVDVYGVTSFPTPGDDHHLFINVNGIELAELWFDGTDVATTAVSVPDGVLVAGTNTLELTAPGDTGNPFDIMAYEGLAAAFTRAPQAVGGAWKGMIDQGGKFAITGFAGDVVAWRGDRRRTGTDTINLRGQGHWIAVEVGETLAPSIQADVPPASGRPPRGQVDYLIIAHDQFVATAALDDLQSLQQARGYSTRVVAAEEIYAHYSDYERSAAAIGEFIRHARPRFVLLVGGDSTDYHDHLGLASQSFVPTHYVQTDDLVTYAPADGPYVDFNGNGTPQAAIGRLPVRTEDELDLLVAKLQTYLPPDTAHFSAGPSDSGRQFAELSEGYAASLSSAWAFEETYADDFAVLADANAALTDALNGTGMLVSYLGHSSFGIWGLNPSHGILFRANEARALANAAPHLITQWGCWNTYFVDPQLDTMANGFLLQDDGAAHVLGAAALTDVNLLRQFGERFFDEIGRQDTVGETLRFAIQRYIQADPNAARALRGFAFLGDPAAPLY